MANLILKNRNIIITKKELKNEVEKGKLILKGINSLEISFTSTVAVSTGLSISVVQPWYIKPVGIRCNGHSYLGAYKFISKSDSDVNDFLKIYNSVQSESALGVNVDSTKQSESALGVNVDSTNNEIIEIRIENNPEEAKVFKGYFTEFKFDEKVESPYILQYSFSFTGISDFQHSISNGMANGNLDNELKALNLNLYNILFPFRWG